MEPARPVRGGTDRAAGRAAAGLAMGTAGGRLSDAGPARGDGAAVDAGARTRVRLAAACLARGSVARVRPRWRAGTVRLGGAVGVAVHRCAIAVRAASATGAGHGVADRVCAVHRTPAAFANAN